LLWAAGELDLHDAVDALWSAAVRDGLVRELGPDEVRRLLADAFAPERDDLHWSQPATVEPKPEPPDDIEDTFAQACRDADEKHRREPVDPTTAKARQLLEDDVSLERAWNELNADRRSLGTAEATIDALMFALRKGIDALKHPDNRRRLSALNDAQIREVATRVQKFKPHIACAWTPEQVKALISIWRKLR
jgi:hypothetical protein